jgi:thiol:disulfide interchange protein DsbD
LKKYLSILFVFVALVVKSQSSQPIQQQLKIAALTDTTYKITATLHAAKDWTIYALNEKDGIDAPKFQLQLETASLLDKISLNGATKQVTNELFKSVQVYSNELVVEQVVAIKGFQPDSLHGVILVNASKGNEFLPLELPVSFPLAHGKASSHFDIKLPVSATGQPKNDCGETNIATTKDSPWSVFFLGFLGGLIALLTPCVFPMIPVTVSFFTKRSKNRKQAIQNGLIYGISITLIYVLASVPFHLLGNVQPEIFNSISTNPWLNLGFFVVFIFFAISFFGYFEITLPSSFASKADSKSGLGSLGGIFFMAITLAIVSFSCTGPILGTLLVSSLQGGAWALTQGMTGFGVALALPFGLFAVFPNLLHNLPKSGSWLDTVKKVLAFVELALALKFLSNADLVEHWGLIKRETFLVIWVVISLGLALYLLGYLHLPHDNKHAKIPIVRRILGVLTIVFTVILCFGMVPKYSKSIQFLSGFPPPTHYSYLDHSEGANVKAQVVNDYAKALELSKQTGKPILIDFTGWACVNCRKMEENVWTDPAVAAYIQSHYILVSLYVDDKALLPVEKRFVYTGAQGQSKSIQSIGDLWATFQAENFNQVTQPLYVAVSPEQQLMSHPIGYTPDVAAYLLWLQCSSNVK